MAVGEISTVSTAWAVFSVVGGSLLGASISAAVSFWTSRKTANAAARQREADRYEARKALAYSLLFKMIRMHSTIVIINHDLQAFVERAKKDGFSTLWQVILPFGNLPDKMKFTPEEMALLLSLDDKLFNDLGPYDDVHNSLLSLCDMYRITRNTTMSRFGATMRGTLGTTSLTKEEAEWLAPRAAEMDMLAHAMVDAAAKETALSRQLLERMNALFVKEFKFNPKLEFRQPDAS